MSTREPVDDAVRELMLLMPRLVGRIKRLPPPEQLRSQDLAPRHLSLLSVLLLDGPQTVKELAEKLGIAATTASLLVNDLSRKGVLERHEDDADRRRRIIDISAASRPAVSQWLSPGARAWREAVAPLTAAQRRTVIDTLLAYEASFAVATEQVDS
ncbi:DNA-binding MarR family transcriptional regulator [Tamaricihabitans halophyticus]|uniref:DNA-binding MarR family transcriptional regulator n=1 Tax=Tamaricihabitans halophyticus TaxID=1262583 RepID=A0A4R2RAC2_9PSEU|nr:MarR family winged helix-turn-helix transcriptional regulator [Tamaricihabitans halophyticus]TCP56651.1 DNA-binding MarR family transcriptional regulator [Tamaricihabitans halophyticus]